jgi:protoporphyrinogen oxidase
MSENRVVIVGAGPAGLAAAYECVKGGIQPFVLERADKVGGISRTERYKGYYLDVGGHRFFTKMERINQLWHGILGEHFLKVQRLSRIYYKGRFFNYPLTFNNAIIKLGIAESLLIVMSYLKAQILPYPEEQNFEQWVSNRFGRRLYGTFFRTYTEKVWGIPCHQIRSEWAAQRIKGLSLVAALSNALLGTQKAKSLIGEFWYPSHGPGMMWEHFRRAIEAQGGQVFLNAEAVRLRHNNGCIESVICNQNGKTSELSVEHLISSAPLPNLVAMFSPKAPDEVLEAARSLSYRAFIMVGLIVQKAQLFLDQWIYIHSPDVKVGRIQNFKNWSPAMVPDDTRTSIGMEYFCDEGDGLWNMSDDQLADLASRELAALGLANPGDVVDRFVIRQPKAYPIYDENYLAHLTIIKEFLETIQNLQTIGRNGMHRYNNMDHAMHTGILAAENILGASHNLWQVGEEEEYLEEDRVLHKKIAKTFARIDKLAFATAVGTTSGLLFFFATIWLIIKGGEVVGPTLQLLAQYFVGYTVTVKGAFVAFGYSFVWAFLFGWLFAYLRNLFLAIYIFYVKREEEFLTVRDFFDKL